jgi:hypothetical protein
MESKSKKNKNIPKPLKKKKTKMSEVKGCGESFSVKSLISKFITNIFENNFSEADKTLQTIVEEKTKDRVKKAAKNAHNKAKGKKPDEDGDGVPDYADEKPGEDDNASKNKKGKLSKEENKKRFLEMIAKKKKNSKKGNK